MAVAQRAPKPVEPAGPSAAELLERATELGFGAIGLAGRAAGTLLARFPGAPRAAPSDPPTTPVALLPGAVVGVAIVAQRVAQILIDEMVAQGAGMARVVTRPRFVRWSLRPFEDGLSRFNTIARRQQVRNEARAAAFMPVLVQRVTENVVAQIDFVSVVEKVPVDEIVARLDIDAIVARVDLVGIMRASTASITSEATDSLREQVMNLDLLAARIVDRVTFRHHPRQLDVDGRS